MIMRHAGEADSIDAAAKTIPCLTARTFGISAAGVTQHDMRLSTKKHILHRICIIQIQCLDAVGLQKYPNQLHTEGSKGLSACTRACLCQTHNKASNDEQNTKRNLLETRRCFCGRRWFTLTRLGCHCA